MVSRRGGALLKERHMVWVNVLACHWYHPERRTSQCIVEAAMRTTQSWQEPGRCQMYVQITY